MKLQQASSEKTKKLTAMMKDYGNCSSFKLLNENEEYFKSYNEPTTAEKDYR
jgi:hypothetical protein